MNDEVTLFFNSRKNSPPPSRDDADLRELSSQNEFNDDKDHEYQGLLRAPGDEAAQYTSLQPERPHTSTYEQIGELMPLRRGSNDGEYTARCEQTDELIKPSVPVQVSDDPSVCGSRRSINTAHLHNIGDIDEDGGNYSEDELERITSFNYGVEAQSTDLDTDLNHTNNNSSSSPYAEIGSQESGEFPRPTTSIAFVDVV